MVCFLRHLLLYSHSLLVNNPSGCHLSPQCALLRPWYVRCKKGLFLLKLLDSLKLPDSKSEIDADSTEGKVVAEDYQGPYLPLAYYVMFPQPRARSLCRIGWCFWFWYEYNVSILLYFIDDVSTVYHRIQLVERLYDPFAGISIFLRMHLKQLSD
jgi:hypothetical protein